MAASATNARPTGAPSGLAGAAPKAAAAFDAIVVGAGPAGTSAALGLAQAGAKVLLLERGEYPGSKNMFGGMMAYCPAPEQLIPDFWKRAPWERAVTKRTLSITSEGSTTSLAFQAELRLRPAGRRRRLHLRQEPHRLHPLPSAVRPLVRGAGGGGRRDPAHRLPRGGAGRQERRGAGRAGRRHRRHRRGASGGRLRRHPVAAGQGRRSAQGLQAGAGGPRSARALRHDRGGHRRALRPHRPGGRHPGVPRLHSRACAAAASSTRRPTPCRWGWSFTSIRSSSGASRPTNCSSGSSPPHRWLRCCAAPGWWSTRPICCPRPGCAWCPGCRWQGCWSPATRPASATPTA